jgi:hypothetical protein
MDEDQRTELHRKIRWQMARAETSLDLAISALARASKLAAIDPVMRDEFNSDLGLLEMKLDRLRRMLA